MAPDLLGRVFGGVFGKFKVYGTGFKGVEVHWFRFL